MKTEIKYDINIFPELIHFIRHSLTRLEGSFNLPPEEMIVAMPEHIFYLLEMYNRENYNYSFPSTNEKKVFGSEIQNNYDLTVVVYLKNFHFYNSESQKKFTFDLNTRIRS